jgi:steroid delta-isomerase-like uncharacterized protein
MEAGTSSAVIVSELLDRVWNDGEVDAAARYIADGYTIHHDPGDPWEGQQLSVGQYAERVSAYRGFFPDLRFTVHELLAGDDKVIVTWLWQGTTAVDQPGFPPSGTVQTATGATVYYIEDGKITGHWQVIHRAEPSTADSAESE